MPLAVTKRKTVLKWSFWRYKKFNRHCIVYRIAEISVNYPLLTWQIRYSIDHDNLNSANSNCFWFPLRVDLPGYWKSVLSAWQHSRIIACHLYLPGTNRGQRICFHSHFGKWRSFVVKSMEFNYHLLRFFCKNYNNDKISDVFDVGQSIFRKFTPKPRKSIQNSKLQMFDLTPTCLQNYVERKHRDFHGTTDRVYPIASRHGIF